MVIHRYYGFDTYIKVSSSSSSWTCLALWKIFMCYESRSNSYPQCPRAVSPACSLAAKATSNKFFCWFIYQSITSVTLKFKYLILPSRDNFLQLGFSLTRTGFYFLYIFQILYFARVGTTQWVKLSRLCPPLWALFIYFYLSWLSISFCLDLAQQTLK